MVFSFTGCRRNACNRMIGPTPYNRMPGSVKMIPVHPIPSIQPHRDMNIFWLNYFQLEIIEQRGKYRMFMWLDSVKSGSTPCHAIAEWATSRRKRAPRAEAGGRGLNLCMIPFTNPYVGGSPVIEPLNRLVSQTTRRILWDMRHEMSRLRYGAHISKMWIMSWRRATHLHMWKGLNTSILSEARHVKPLKKKWRIENKAFKRKPLISQLTPPSKKSVGDTLNLKFSKWRKLNLI